MKQPQPTHRQTSKKRAMRPAQGFTLLEVILALAILGVSIAVVGQSFRLAHRSALEARQLTTAQLLAVTKMSEISAGITPAISAEGVPFEEAQDWLYSISAEPLDDPEGLMVIAVVVTPRVQNPRAPVRFQLVRWMSESEIVTEEDTEDDGSGSEGEPSEEGSSGGRDE